MDLLSVVQLVRRFAMDIFTALRGAEIIRVDCARKLFLAWSGGTGIHAYDKDGVPVYYWLVDSHETNASEEEIVESMDERIESGKYI